MQSPTPRSPSSPPLSSPSTPQSISRPVLRVVEGHPLGRRSKREDASAFGHNRRRLFHLTVETDDNCYPSSLHSSPVYFIRPLPSIPLRTESRPLTPQSAPLIYSGQHTHIRPLPLPPQKPSTMSSTKTLPVSYATRRFSNNLLQNHSCIVPLMESVARSQSPDSVETEKQMQIPKKYSQDGWKDTEEFGRKLVEIDPSEKFKYRLDCIEESMGAVESIQIQSSNTVSQRNMGWLSGDSGYNSNDVSDSDDDEDSDIVSLEDEDEDVVDSEWIINKKTNANDTTPLAKRFSKKWLREKNGRQWVEEDYASVLKFLRTL